jgi:hypothetical protein
VACSCEHDNELLNFLTGEEFFSVQANASLSRMIQLHGLTWLVKREIYCIK